MAASPKTIGTHSLVIAASAKRRRQTSGPTPAGSPIVTAILGRDIERCACALLKQKRAKEAKRRAREDAAVNLSRQCFARRLLKLSVSRCTGCRRKSA